VLGGSVPLKIDQSSFGWAAQIGADFQIAPQWFFNVDLKYVAIDTDIRVKASGAKVTQLNIDPLLFSVGVGYRF
jgi:outer membrane protein